MPRQAGVRRVRPGAGAVIIPTSVPVKQAVISPSALSLLYPRDAIAGYSRDAFVDDLLREHETEVRRCLRMGAHGVQVDFTEGRLGVKLDPSGGLLASFVDLNNDALARFSDEELKRIGVHTCAGSDCDSTRRGEVAMQNCCLVCCNCARRILRRAGRRKGPAASS